MIHEVQYLNDTDFFMKGSFENELRKKLKFFHQRMVTTRGTVTTRGWSPLGAWSSPEESYVPLL